MVIKGVVKERSSWQEQKMWSFCMIICPIYFHQISLR